MKRICTKCGSEDFKCWGNYPDDESVTLELSCAKCDNDLTEVQKLDGEVISQVFE